ncbi:NADH-quinone oxidoreductase subunit M [Actinocorallia sp. A-T 12471]|uniref:NADH-quinone oxidoreductase subunit M n=1 Tax=Actinocorallia sp. A-T 12471 TaxID=3089813 RepID=UPI0029D2F23B|nr:NADH-quinone oxidoreductase subunit M [Actinocorallia sp. A-T 12471]MDX6741732.1 NADH-quinone oxidoreductase subunit M [Actinocorallia sp. A-T 12471]
MLSALIALPALGALVVALLPKGRDELAKQIGLGVALLVLVFGVTLAAGWDTGSTARYQFAETYWWIKDFGVHWAVGLDGMALVLVLLSLILVPLVMLASWTAADRYGGAFEEVAAARAEQAKAAEEAGKPGKTPFGVVGSRSAKTYFALILLMESMMIGVFAATDVFLFYVFFEAILIPVYFLVGLFGGPQRSYAAVKFLLYSLFGGLLMLVAVIGLYVVADKNTFLITELTGVNIDPATAKWLFLGFFIAFAIKAPMFPVHTWLPDTAAQAPAGALVLIVGVLDKIGTYGMIRFCLELFPGASKWATPVVIVFAVISIVYGAVLAIGQVDLKRLIAYTSISHFGFIVLGIFAMTSMAQSGAILYMVNHGFSTGALFLAAGYLIVRRGSARIDAYGGVQKVAPLLAGTFLIAGLSALSLPGLSTFVSEFMVLVGTFTRYQVAAIIAVSGIVLAALYVLWAYQRIAGGPAAEAISRKGAFPDLSRRELAAIGPILAVIVLLGFFPGPIVNVINPTVEHTLSVVDMHDPEPTVAEAPGGQP